MRRYTVLLRNVPAGVSAAAEFSTHYHAEATAHRAERREGVSAAVVGHLDGGQREAGR